MHKAKIINRDETPNSLQVSVLHNVTAGNFFPGVKFLIKNITEETITIEIRPSGQKEFISTTLYPGWNPEICEEIKAATAGTLQYGY